MKRLVIAGLLLLSLSHTAHAQGCSICTKTAADLDPKSAKGLNNGILYLAMLPLGIIGTLGVVWWRSKR